MHLNNLNLLVEWTKSGGTNQYERWKKNWNMNTCTGQKTDKGNRKLKNSITNNCVDGKLNVEI